MTTEKRNEHTLHIDKMSTKEMLEAIQRENVCAAESVGRAIAETETAIDKIFARMERGGRLFYVGCGTSGRIGVLDASELPPTFGVSPDLVVGIIAGGDKALRTAVEGAEDSYESGRRNIAEYAITANDSVIGISAAGGAAYVLGALEYAKKCGAFTVALTSNNGTKIGNAADCCIVTDTGPEAITGSTRMKAGTAQKLVLNMISTSLMVKAGYVYENIMINLKPTNIKLKNRMIGIVSELTRKDMSESEQLLEKSSWNIKKAVSLSEKQVNKK